MILCSLKWGLITFLGNVTYRVEIILRSLLISLESRIPRSNNFIRLKKFFHKNIIHRKIIFFSFFPNSFITIVGTKLFNIDKFDLDTRVKHAIKIFSIHRYRSDPRINTKTRLFPYHGN